MELAATGMTDRQRKYRATYRERVVGWYNGWLHVVLIYTIGFTALYVYLANLHDVKWWEYLTIPVVFLIIWPKSRMLPTIIIPDLYKTDHSLELYRV